MSCPGWSGALIAPDLVLTARHAPSEDLCVVLDYEDTTEDGKPPEISRDNVIPATAWDPPGADPQVDARLLRLERAVTDREPIPMSSRRPNIGEGIYMVGHPLGLDRHLTGNAVVRSQQELWFTSTLDAFRRNSGSPVFIDDDEGACVGVVSGISHADLALLSGPTTIAPDLVDDEERGCKVLIVVGAQSNITLEQVEGVQVVYSDLIEGVPGA